MAWLAGGGREVLFLDQPRRDPSAAPARGHDAGRLTSAAGRPAGFQQARFQPLEIVHIKLDFDFLMVHLLMIEN
jgi:hypothetical protein